VSAKECVVRRAVPTDREWIAALLDSHWGGEPMIVRGVEWRLLEMPALLAGEGEGIAIYSPGDEDAAPELLLLHALRAGVGVGSALLDALVAELRALGRRSLVVTSSNDNLAALGVLSAVWI
jgi:GNAT superfamily N-acetyltransferase